MNRLNDLLISLPLLVLSLSAFDAAAIRNPNEPVRVVPVEKPSLQESMAKNDGKEQAHSAASAQGQQNTSQLSQSGASNAKTTIAKDQVNASNAEGQVKQTHVVPASKGANSANNSTGVNSQIKGKALTLKREQNNSLSKSDNRTQALANSRGVGHTKPRDNEDKKQSINNSPSTTVPMVVSESENLIEKSLDQGLIEAQIDDVLSSAEFLALEASVKFTQSQPNQPSAEKALMDANFGTDPELLLNQLDASDLMDYVAEDDLWKEQLTIEDEPL